MSKRTPSGVHTGVCHRGEWKNRVSGLYMWKDERARPDPSNSTHAAPRGPTHLEGLEAQGARVEGQGPVGAVGALGPLPAQLLPLRGRQEHAVLGVLCGVGPAAAGRGVVSQAKAPCMAHTRVFAAAAACWDSGRTHLLLPHLCLAACDEARSVSCSPESP